MTFFLLGFKQSIEAVLLSSCFPREVFDSSGIGIQLSSPDSLCQLMRLLDMKL